MQAAELRRAFRQFFVERDHVPVPSAGLIPHHARAPLFTNAGMNQFIPYFLGEEIPPYKRATTIQKCVRIRGKHDDIEQVGRTTRHLTFFEMLGNFSFGDYFKAEAIPFAWELLTEVLGFDGDRLWATVYIDDDESADIWRDDIRLPADRIVRMTDDNFWEMGDTGPCGPDSEIFFDRGPQWGPDGGPAKGGEERYVEVWNLVFPQFNRQPDGSLSPLPHPGIDTGAGFERMLMLLQGRPSVWETDTLRPIIARAEQLTRRRYGDNTEVDVALRILADHARSVSFLISDGVFPSNEDRGYVLRRLIRRTVRQAYQLGVETPVTPPLVDAVVEVMGEAYPDLARHADFVSGVVGREEDRFRATLRSGLTMLEEALGSRGPVSGEVAFRLHDTHGFPIELTREIAAERGLDVDEEGFEAAMARQRSKSQAAAGKTATDAAGEGSDAYKALLDAHGPTRFVGYTATSTQARVLAVLNRGNGEVEVFLDQTPFYAEGGGQVGDTGVIETDTGTARVLDTTQALAGLSRHTARLEHGEIRAGQTATAVIDVARRQAIRRNHTGTHLLHWALREVLGDHVKQQGSLVAPDRLRFDFNHYEPVRPDELAEVEDLVNAHVLADEPVVAEVMTKADADAAGAIAFFDEKYGDQVRVVHAGNESLELCGGTHVDRLGQIGPIEIVSEGSIGANLRRIEATTGTVTLARLRELERTVLDAAGLLRATPDELTSAIERKLADLRAADERLKSAQRSALAGRVDGLLNSAVDRSVVARVDGLPSEQLRDLAAQVRQRGELRAVVLGGSPDGAKVALVAVAAPGATPNAPELLGEAARTVGGGGGGRNPEHAVAGGRDPSKLGDALNGVRSLLGLPSAPP